MFSGVITVYQIEDALLWLHIKHPVNDSIYFAMHFGIHRSDKTRLYVALYARGGAEPDTYHWALVTGPKTETASSRGHRFHVRHRAYEGGNRWEYEELEIPTAPTRMILVRLAVAKVVHEEQMAKILRAVPVVQNNPNWTCRIWVKEALAALVANGHVLGTAVTDWTTIENTAKQYARQKKDQHRFDGKAEWDTSKVPTFDMMENKELTP
ncbi:hypothetical protein VTO42DRAFT_7220 [Malbranchea cinnamomea]